ncbi:alcohol dehydrogenase catalytic domain-containing protein [Shouchella sp. 1P09AA]|uniref:alcohol dehydrogenase catalytic domain-containing protein n=1 Tax=unclassified Shouchella TaxID=2893065 RepID=UPI0039A28DA5
MIEKETILSKTYRLTEPWKIGIEAIERELKEGDVLVQPTLASICHADLRYYTGQRRPEALQKKLPMALLHESIGTVIKSRHNDRQVGDRVVIVPNVPGSLLERRDVHDVTASYNEENYSRDNVFLGSGYDGAAQEHLVLPAACTVVVPNDVPDEIAVLAELCTVSNQAIQRAGITGDQEHVAVFGDGPVGFITAALLHYVYGVSSERLHAFGAVEEKIASFTFAKRHLVQSYDFSKEPLVDAVFECTGGRFSESAANQAIDLVKREGNVVLMGVTEDKVPLNTRDILEKGIRLVGSSRSSVGDFQTVVEGLRNKDFQHALSALVPDEFHTITCADDLMNALNETAAHKAWKKTFVTFTW